MNPHGCGFINVASTRIQKCSCGSTQFDRKMIRSGARGDEYMRDARNPKVHVTSVCTALTLPKSAIEMVAPQVREQKQILSAQEASECHLVTCRFASSLKNSKVERRRLAASQICSELFCSSPYRPCHPLSRTLRWNVAAHRRKPRPQRAVNLEL